MIWRGACMNGWQSAGDTSALIDQGAVRSAWRNTPPVSSMPERMSEIVFMVGGPCGVSVKNSGALLIGLVIRRFYTESLRLPSG